MSLFQLFKKKPSDDVINEILQVNGFNSFNDPKEVSRTHLDSDDVINKYMKIQDSIATFYIPCKSKKYILDIPAGKNIITILRHLLKTRGYSVLSQEKYKSGHKIIIYKIIPKANNKNNNEQHIVKFD